MEPYLLHVSSAYDSFKVFRVSDKYHMIARPNIPRSPNQIQDISVLDIENFLVNDVLCCCCNCCGCRNGHCACCGQPSEAMLLPYKLAQISLFTVGCCSGCGMYQWVGGEPLHQRIGMIITCSYVSFHRASTAGNRSRE